MLGKAKQVSLTKCGVRIRDAAKKGIGNSAPHKKKRSGKRSALFDNLQEIGGGLYRDVSQINIHEARAPGKPVKSWAPRRFLYKDLKYYWDDGAKSVVIGPYSAPWLNRLHEFGGTLRFTAWVIGDRAARRAKIIRQTGGKDAGGATFRGEVGYVRWVQKGQKQFAGQRVRGHIRPWRHLDLSKTVRFPARPFMQGSEYVKKALERISEEFKDMLRPNG